MIYPFELTIFIPYLANDSTDLELSNLNHVSQPYSYLIGIIAKDKNDALEILWREIEYDEKTSPIIVDLTSAHKKTGKSPIVFIEKTPGIVLKKGEFDELPSSYTKDNSLPRQEEEKLIKDIKHAKKRDVCRDKV